MFEVTFMLMCPQFNKIEAPSAGKLEQAMVSFHLLPAPMILTDSALCLFWVASARLWATDWHSRDKLSSSWQGQAREIAEMF